MEAKDFLPGRRVFVMVKDLQGNYKKLLGTAGHLFGTDKNELIVQFDTGEVATVDAHKLKWFSLEPTN